MNSVGKIVYAENTEHKNSHAEQNLLKKINGYLSVFSIPAVLVIRLSKNNELGESAMCNACICAFIKALEKSYKLGKTRAVLRNNTWIYHSTSQGKITKLRLSELINQLHLAYTSSGNKCRNWRHNKNNK
jgi:hypothetical protein